MEEEAFLVEVFSARKFGLRECEFSQRDCARIVQARATNQFVLPGEALDSVIGGQDFHQEDQ